MVNQDLERGFKFADAFFCGVWFVAAHPARSIRCVVLGKRKRFVALRVLASSFHTDAVTEARGGFTEEAFIKLAGRPRHPSGLEQRDREGGR